MFLQNQLYKTTDLIVQIDWLKKQKHKTHFRSTKKNKSPIRYVYIHTHVSTLAILSFSSFWLFFKRKYENISTLW